MPFGGGKTSTVNVSGLNWDGDLIIPTGKKITSVDTSGTVGANLLSQMAFLLGVAGWD